MLEVFSYRLIVISPFIVYLVIPRSRHLCVCKPPLPAAESFKPQAPYSR